MTLVIDNRAALGDRPGVHALFAGVSFYRHLPGGGETPAVKDFGLSQLSSTALSAYKMFRWLEARQNRLPLPLATCRLLLSPSPGEAAAESRLGGLAEACIEENFTRNAIEWRDDAGNNRQNTTLFYFAGHGIEREQQDGVLLFEDFGNPVAGGALKKAASVNNLKFGMAPSEDFPEIARSQLFFVDACRALPSEVKDYMYLPTSDPFDAPRSVEDDRKTSIFFATIPGIEAYAFPNQQTLFSKALIKCLDGAAGDVYENPDTSLGYYVSVQTINKTLDAYFDELIGLEGAGQEFSLTGSRGDTIIHLLDGPPTVDIMLDLDPEDALPHAFVEVISGDPAVAVAPLPAPLPSRPFKCTVPLGVYTFKATINPPNGLYKDFAGRAKKYLPPFDKWKGVVKQ